MGTSNRALPILLAPAAFAALFAAAGAFAREAETEESSPVPCALVTGYAGEADLLDSSRTHLLKMGKGAAVPCGGWISVKTGIVELKHRDGQRLHISTGAFAQLPENNPDGKFSGDHLVIFSGEAYVSAAGDGGETRVVTANARSRVSKGSALVVYDPGGDETQLITLSGVSRIENRFEPSRQATVRAGEASSLNFKLLRVVPSQPRAVAIAALRPKFGKLKVPAREGELAVRHASARLERTLAAALVAKPAPGAQAAPGPEAPAVVVKRTPASAGTPTYERHDGRETQEIDSLRKHWQDHVVAGAPGAEGLLHPAPRAPAAGPRAKGKVTVSVHDAEGRHPAQARPSSEDSEKRRLIDELSRIREE